MGKYRSNLQAMRKRAGFKSAREFAEHAGINAKTYTNHEQGDVSMSLLQAWEYADLLNCTLDELAGRKSPNTQPSISADEQEIIDAYRSDRRTHRAIDHAISDYIEDMELDAREKRAV